MKLKLATSTYRAATFFLGTIAYIADAISDAAAAIRDRIVDDGEVACETPDDSEANAECAHSASLIISTSGSFVEVPTAGSVIVTGAIVAQPELVAQLLLRAAIAGRIVNPNYGDA